MKTILHADREWGIGKNNGLMFRIPADMKFFAKTTTGNVVVMGGKTLRSFPGGKPLKDRVNIVLSKTEEEREGIIVVRSLEELFAEIKKYDKDKVFVIGGANVYKRLLPYCDEVLLTKVDAVGNADSYFENLDKNPDFELVYKSEPTETNGYMITFTTYKNNNVKNY